MRSHSCLIVVSEKILVQGLYTQFICKVSQLGDFPNIDVVLTVEIASAHKVNIVLQHLYEATRNSYGLDVDIQVGFAKWVFKDPHKQWSQIYIADGDNIPHQLQLNNISNVEPVHICFNPSDTSTTEYTNESSANDFNAEQFRVVAVGGTFDHLHDGHKILLGISAFLSRDELIVGVTGEAMLKNKKYKDYLESFIERKEKILRFLDFAYPGLPVAIHEINDVCGPTATVREIEGLVVSEETSSGGEYVNKVRREKNLPALEVFVVNVLGGSDKTSFSDKLSSTELRRRDYEKATAQI
ncbi:Putative pantetheine-phosphate adenylyltransferase [Komagataella phaffii CBS 7435]|uniref:Pantetheine-phosphate adenylyltransferase (PPAT) n=2 Tax=Komagataella phaffii TaxID=460519 RepID=C4R6M5_KOMPG|nr:Putative pantetheine-phosphate adenylyltransferase (PPAT) [Komagataella phaffii GS115]AOA64804.1 GQ67_04331T0 [Komagataella phaffii]CAH2451411.1 Putative pantetheine-phosphate adenylyltransferase [Komagataella phaffii CBS 7435]AOA70074.1 GQ68_04303T0 [Komagataella phaffii GS115]CAY71250.1 Putative pantetheine-phosphate adenylyltransferase (PPAT) [Komagataella phaffii GS115]CCA41144.1 Putative pantetheine-phosphate adenylyltransferase [Komagataella phaffii CBS 7435]